MKRPLAFLPLALLAGCGALLTGCGGSDATSSFLEGSSGTVNVAFSGATGNATAPAAFTAATSLSGSAVGKVVEIQATNGDRSLDVSLIGNKDSAGATASLSSSSGSLVVYKDSTNTWSVVSGTLTVGTRSTSGVAITLTNVVLTDTAGDTITANGTLTFVPG